MNRPLTNAEKQAMSRSMKASWRKKKRARALAAEATHPQGAPVTTPEDRLRALFDTVLRDEWNRFIKAWTLPEP